jgi:hypothetical protein
MRPLPSIPCLVLSLLTCLLPCGGATAAGSITQASPGAVADNVSEDTPTLRLAGELLRRDLQAISGQPVRHLKQLEDCTRTCIVIGRHDAPLLQGLARDEGLDTRALRGEWERYVRTGIASRKRPGVNLLVIAGSDARGAVYGGVDLSRELGVSAWEWWADVKPAVQSTVAVRGERLLSDAPSVRYRGIFLNDEDWGLQPWAAKTLDPAGDIGPATYARIFELLWRLKANLVWPAMHDSTKPFYQIPGNAQMARDYAIVVGTSHAEPMMRNNVREWNKADGPFNWFTNRDALVRYWRQRVGQVQGHDVMMSMGIRGVHDSAMEGANTVAEARQGLQDVIAVQRGMLDKTTPQALTLYKEVLDIYNSGLQLPDDITLVWPDDNYGYLHQLSNAREAARPGGAGLYYHISYWGRPHDYLWLGTTHPGLVRDQLQRAVHTGVDRVWVVNVGDIKPNEYLTQYFLDAAFDKRQLERGTRQHLTAWAATQFGARHADQVTAVMQEYYGLAWERRPEFMGFSQTEPTMPTRQSDYLQAGGEEAELRLARYAALARRAQAIADALPPALRDAYFQLVLYPVRSAANLNARILKLDLAAQYARMGRPSAQRYARQAQAAQAAIDADTARYNTQAGGKWRGMMDAAPRRLPVFMPPLFPDYPVAPRADKGCGIVYPAPLSAQGDVLAFTKGRPETRTITVVQYGATDAAWRATGVAPGITLSAREGILDSDNGHEQRIGVHYDGGAAGALTLMCGGAQVKVNVRVAPGAADGVATEQDRIITLPATAAEASAGWETIDTGSFGAAMRAAFDTPSRDSAIAASPVLRYRFHSHTAGAAQLRLVALPVHPLTSDNRLRMAVAIDGAHAGVVDTTTHGRSDEWKNNVLTNTAVRTIPLPHLAPGEHTVEVRALDPGVALDRIEIRFDGAPVYYGKAPVVTNPAP